MQQSIFMKQRHFNVNPVAYIFCCIDHFICLNILSCHSILLCVHQICFILYMIVQSITGVPQEGLVCFYYRNIALLFCSASTFTAFEVKGRLKIIK